MTVPHEVVFLGALAALLALPCAVNWLVHTERRVIRYRSWRCRDPRDVAALRQLERRVIHSRPHAETALPSLDQIAAELRRLDRQRRCGPTTQSAVWSTAVSLAYDEWLQVACRSLGVAEYLQPLTDMDRDLERVRVQAVLQARGLAVRNAPVEA